MVENKEDVDKFKDFKVEDVAAAPSSAPAAPKETPTASSTPAPAESVAPAASAPASGRIFSTPMAKTLAAEKGISLSSVKASGPEGVIIKADVLNHKGSDPFFLMDWADVY